jgi:hypothetical protein
MLIFIFIIITFLAGIYFCLKHKPSKFLVEGFEVSTNEEVTKSNPRCPNILIQSGSQFFLYNSKLAKVPGVNPVQFNNLEEYTEFLDWQRSQGIRCPVLYLQKTYDAQGKPVYKVRPSVSELQGGLPSTGTQPNPTKLVDATRNDPPYNVNSYPAYDQTSYYVGSTTPLDQMDETQDGLLYSPNPMDDNWGGAAFTQSLVDKGYYSGNEVSISV